MSTVIAGYDQVVFDLDGVVYLGEQPIHAAATVIERLVEAGVHCSYATNNASRRASEVADLLRRLGVPAQPADVVTSAEAAAAYLAKEFEPRAPVFVVGAEALRAEVVDQGLTPVPDAGGLPVAVVQGYGAEVGWVHLAEATVAIRAGARWVVTNVDKTLPSPRGPLPGNGSLVAVVTTALGRMPDLVVGKPAPQLFQAARDRAGARMPLVVGDRLDTDIEGANRAGFDSLLVLTGVTDARAVLAAPPHQRPTMVARTLDDLLGEHGDVTIAANAGGWHTDAGHEAIELSGAGSLSAALAALCAETWRSAGARPIVAGSIAAARALAELGLT